MSVVEDATGQVKDDTLALLREVKVGETLVTLLGTAHVSRSSAEQVAAELDSKAYQAVAIELCPSRFDALNNPDRLAQLDLMQVLRQGKASMVMANLAMAAYQQRLGEQLGIEPGAEMRMAVTQAEVHGLPVVLIDREIGITLKRTARNLSWWRSAPYCSAGWSPAWSHARRSAKRISNTSRRAMSWRPPSRSSRTTVTTFTSH